MTERVVLVRPFALQHRFGAAVSHLLLQVSLQGVAPVMPDCGSGVEADGSALLDQSPTQVDVVSCRSELRVAAANCEQGVASEGHVAAWDMLGLSIANQHMDRSAWRVRHALTPGTSI